MLTLALVQKFWTKLVDQSIGMGKRGVMFGKVGLFYLNQNIFKILRMVIHPNKMQPSAIEPVSLP